MFGNKNLLAIDIGTSLIKMAELQFKGKQIHLTRFHTERTPPEAVESGDFTNYEVIPSVIKSLYKAGGFTRKKVAINIWGPSVITKKVNIPKTEAALLDEQVRFEAEQYIPFDIKNVLFDYVVLKKPSLQANSQDVIITAILDEHVLKFIEIIERSGLSCSVMDTSSFAMAASYFHNYGEKDKEVVALLNIGNSYTNFSFVQEGDVIFCRDLPIGGQVYTIGIQEQMGVSMEEAENFKIEDCKNNKLDSIQTVLNNGHQLICEELKGILDFFTETSGDTVSRCFVTGGGARTPGLKELLSESLNVSCESLDPFSKIQCTGKLLTKSYLKDISDMASIAIGLGLRKERD